MPTLAEPDAFCVSSDETVVRSTCPTCGTVDVAADAVTLFVTGPDSDPTYCYTCPQCFGHVEKPTSSRAISMLRSAGARVVLVPAEVTERAGDVRAARQELDDDDLLAFMRELAATDDLARFAQDCQ